MVDLHEEQKMYELEDSISKSIFLLNNMMDAYDLETLIKSKDDALAFGIMKHDIYMNVRIIHDYLLNAKNVLVQQDHISY